MHGSPFQLIRFFHGNIIISNIPRKIWIVCAHTPSLQVGAMLKGEYVDRESLVWRCALYPLEADLLLEHKSECKVSETTAALSLEDLWLNNNIISKEL